MKYFLSALRSQTIKDTVISFIGVGVTAIVGFFYTIILARVLGPQSFGIFSAITALMAIVYSLGDLGIASAIINLLPRNSHLRLKIISTAFWVEMVVALLVGALFVFFAFTNQIVIPGSVPSQLLLVGILAINYLLIGFAQGVFTAERLFLRLSFSQIIDAVIKILAVFIILRFSRLSINLALLANIFSSLIALVITFGHELWNIKTVFEKNLFFKLFHFAKWIAISKIFSVFVFRFDIVLLNLLSSSYQAGIYSVANRITMLFAMIVSSIGSVVNPRFASFDTASKITSYMKKLFGLVSIVSLSMIVVIIFARPIIHVVFGEKYLSAIPVFQLLTASMIPFVYSLVTTPALLYSFHQPKFISFLVAIQVTTMFILEIVYIPKLGNLAPPLVMGLVNTFFLIVSFIKVKICLASYEEK